jgi:hypothetical protein
MNGLPWKRFTRIWGRTTKWGIWAVSLYGFGNIRIGNRNPDCLVSLTLGDDPVSVRILTSKVRNCGGVYPVSCSHPPPSLAYRTNPCEHGRHVDRRDGAAHRGIRISPDPSGLNAEDLEHWMGKEKKIRIRGAEPNKLRLSTPYYLSKQDIDRFLNAFDEYKKAKG